MNIELYEKHCCGCGECAVICPQGAIEMKTNSQGFKYPVVENSRCTDCSMCIDKCTFNHQPTTHLFNQTAYAAKNLDEEVRKKARSGGIFTAISDEIIQLGGTVYGCVLRDNVEAIHERVTTAEECEKFHGSKYIQSDILLCYDHIRKDLIDGLWVLFSGTACQVAAVKDYCKDVDCSKLLLVDIVCHGVPSPKVWNDYSHYISRKHHKKIVSADFRDKERFGWAAHYESFEFDDGTVYSGDTFTKLFYSHLILRDSCFECPYKNLDRIGDITLADCWGIAENEPPFDDDKGVSLVLVSTAKGIQFFNRIKMNISSIQINIDQYRQAPIKENWEKPHNYELFWKDYSRVSFKKIITTYVNTKKNNLLRRLLGAH